MKPGYCRYHGEGSGGSSIAPEGVTGRTIQNNMSTGTYIVYIIAFSSLMGNATATGSILLFGNNGRLVVQDNVAMLIAETVFFVALAVLILVKLLDKVVRERYYKLDRGGNVRTRDKKSKKHRSASK